jgi:ketosteroid isomerase-like protein
MSENLDLVHSILADWERGDFSSAEWADSEIEYISAEPVAIPIGPTGLGEMARVWRDWLRAWDDFHVDGEEFREIDGERVLVLIRYGGRGSPSGMQVTPMEAACLFHVRDGKVVKLVLHRDRERALADLGSAE